MSAVDPAIWLTWTDCASVREFSQRLTQYAPDDAAAIRHHYNEYTLRWLRRALCGVTT